MSTVGIVVGNPKARSRTRAVAEAVASRRRRCRWAGRRRAGRGRPRRSRAPTLRLVVDPGARCSGADPRHRRSPSWRRRRTRRATPGCSSRSSTGSARTDLLGVTVIPVMVGAGLQHALAVEVHLRPVLVELGASLPTRGLYVSEDQLARSRRRRRRMGARGRGRRCGPRSSGRVGRMRSRTGDGGRAAAARQCRSSPMTTPAPEVPARAGPLRPMGRRDPRHAAGLSAAA